MIRAAVPGDTNIAFDVDLSWKIEEAKLLWAQNRPELAMRLAAGTLKHPGAAASESIFVPRLNTLLGKWQSQQRYRLDEKASCKGILPRRHTPDSLELPKTASHR